MEQTMQDFAFLTANEAFENFNDYSLAARHIRDAFDKKYR